MAHICEPADQDQCASKLNQSAHRNRVKGGQYWSDGFSQGPLGEPLDFPAICQECSVRDWFTQLEETEYARLRGCSDLWWPEYLQLLDDYPDQPAQQRLLRLKAWWCSNHELTGRKLHPTQAMRLDLAMALCEKENLWHLDDEQLQQRVTDYMREMEIPTDWRPGNEHAPLMLDNMQVLAGMLDADVEGERLLLIELLRQLGQVDQSADLLQYPWSAAHQEMVELLQSLANDEASLPDMLK